jgi:hypothetical protein
VYHYHLKDKREIVQVVRAPNTVFWYLRRDISQPQSSDLSAKRKVPAKHWDRFLMGLTTFGESCRATLCSRNNEAACRESTFGRDDVAGLAVRFVRCDDAKDVQLVVARGCPKSSFSRANTVRLVARCDDTAYTQSTSRGCCSVKVRKAARIDDVRAVIDQM